MKKDYMETIGLTLEQANRKAYLYGDGKAWDNRKHKIYQRHTPRGKVYERLRKAEWKRMGEALKKLIGDLESFKTPDIVVRLLEETMDA